MDVLVCGAAGNFLVPADQLSPNGFKTVIEIDLLGSFNASRAACRSAQGDPGDDHLRLRRDGVLPHAYQVHVGAAKAGIDMMMKNLALEWGPHGIRVNSIVPGPIEGTEGMKRLASPEATCGAGRNRAAAPDGHGRRHRPDGRLSRLPAGRLHHRLRPRCDGGQNLPGSAPFNAGAERALQAQEGDRARSSNP